jgi:phage I-like protein
MTSGRAIAQFTRIAVCSALAAASAVAVAACAFELPMPAEGESILLQVTPAGEFGPSDGRAMDVPVWRIDAASAQRVIERFRARQQPPVIDYEHQTLHKEANGQPAPAAAWIKDLRWVEGQGLFAVATPTQRAREAIAAREYLYFSPVFEYSQRDGTVLDVLMGALTNNPAIHGMQALSLAAVASAHLSNSDPSHSKERPVNPVLKALLAALGLPETTIEETALTALAALGPLTALQAQAAAARKALGLAADATGDAVTAACTSLQAKAKAEPPDPAKFVPIAVVEELRTSLAALTAKQNASEVDDLVKPALADGRLLPVQEAWARELGKKDIAALTAYLKTAQPIAALIGSQTGGQPPKTNNEHGLSADEIAVAAATGIPQKDFAAAKKA